MRKTTEIRDTMEAGNSSLSETVVIDDNVAFEGQCLTHLESSTQDIIINSTSLAESTVALCSEKANVRYSLNKANIDKEVPRTTGQCLTQIFEKLVAKLYRII